MSIWYFAAPFLLLAFVAIVAALASGIPEAQHEDDLHAGRDDTRDDHMRVALEETSATPLYDAVAIEIFQQQLDGRIQEALKDWGREDIA